MGVHEPRNRSTATATGSHSRWGSLPSSVTHLMVGFVGFQIGFVLGGTNCLTVSPLLPETKAAEDLLCSEPPQGKHEETSDAVDRLFPSTMGSLFVGAARVNRTDFAMALDVGVPVVEPGDGSAIGNEEVLILYNSEESLPSKSSPATSRVARYDNTQEAIQNCKAVRVVLMESRLQSECLAIMGQWESSHVHLFRRVPPDDDTSTTDRAQRKELPLRYVSRLVSDKGIEVKGASIPRGQVTNGYWKILMDFLNSKDATLERLKPLAKSAAGNGNAVVVMLVNWGQAGLFFNFVCAARSRGFDLSNIVMFATDQAAVELATSLGVKVFDVKDSFGDMPEQAAKKFGDPDFVGMMYAKVYCVHLLIQLGYDVLFQDVDLVWKRNPLDFFHSSKVGDYDMLFQDDGARIKRFGPYFANSGFYFVKNNVRTLYFFNQFVRMGDLIKSHRSHQAAMTALMNEHASWRGLRVKVFGRDSPDGELFPGGYHYHRRKDFMKRFANGTAHPYLFHMSWTESKDNKRLFFQQLGEWYVKAECEEKKASELKSTKGVVDVSTSCCSLEPLVQCHFRDKPSKINCQDSEPLDKGKPSFW